MSDVLARPRGRAAGARPGSAGSNRATRTNRPARAAQAPAPLWMRGAFAATWVVALGVAVLVIAALAVWADDSRSRASASAAIRFAVALWLAAHRVPLHVGDATIAIAPLGLTLLLGLLIVRAAVLVARGAECKDVAGVAAVAMSIALPYAVIATVLAAVAGSAEINPAAGAAFVMTLLVAGAAATVGAWRGAQLGPAAWTGVPERVRGAGRAAAMGGAVLFGGATVLAVASLFGHAGAIGDGFDAYGNGSGKFAMAAISMFLVPNAVISAAAYLTGTGFAVGAGTSVALGGVHLGAMPAVPILGAVPQGPAPAPLAVLCVGLVVAAGVAAGWRVRAERRTLLDQLRVVAWVGCVVGVSMALLAAVAGGPAGPGRLSAIGPSPWQAGLSVGGEIAGVAAITVAVRAWIGLARASLRR